MAVLSMILKVGGAQRPLPGAESFSVFCQHPEEGMSAADMPASFWSHPER